VQCRVRGSHSNMQGDILRVSTKVLFHVHLLNRQGSLCADPSYSRLYCLYELLCVTVTGKYAGSMLESTIESLAC